jgi:hypothetical protein
MSGKLTIALLTAIFLTAPAASALATCQGDKCIPDGAAKGQANEGAFHPQTHGQPGMAVKNGGIPQNTATKRTTDSTSPNTTTFDPGHGTVTGRRQHQP